ncbi:solute carrier family 22 member 6-like [Babylonia areolata]|uniref:solute carrier family 22 member 6-like n=1 Tax=Babylonia areolata TaxID=304850 RepID=UPI003FD4DCC3
MKGQGQGQMQGQVDAILEQLGPLSVYSLLQWSGYAVCMIPISFQMFAIVFTGKDVAHVCSSLSSNTTVDHMTETRPFQLFESGEFSGNNTNRSSLMYSETLSSPPGVRMGEPTQTVPDRNARDNTSNTAHAIFHKDASIASEFDLVCDQAALLDLTQMLLAVGQFLGSLYLPAVADRLGRKRMHIIAHALTAVSGVAVALSPSYVVLAVSKVFVGMGIIGLRLSSSTAMLELFPARFRSLATAVVGGVLFSACSALMSPVAFLLRHHSWRTVQLVFTSVCLLIVLQIVFLDEPLRSLLASHKEKEALKVLRRAARWNKKDLRLLQQLGALLPSSQQPPVVSTSNPKDTTADEDATKQHEPIPPLTVKSGAFSDDGRVDSSVSPAPSQADSSMHGSGTRLSENAIRHVTRDGEHGVTLLRQHPGPLPNNGGDGGCHTPDSSASSAGFIEEGPVAGSSGPQQHGDGVPEGEGPRRSDARAAPVNICHVLKHRRMRIHLIISCLLWFSGTMTYFGLYLTSGSLAGDLYVNFCLNALVELPSCFIYFFTLDRYGRKWTLISFQVLGGVCLISSGICRLFPEYDSTVLASTALYMLGKLGVTGAINVMIMYTGELFPTVCRNQGVGAAVAAGRFGIMIAPFGATLAQHLAWAPGVVFGGISLLTVCAVFFVPETMGRELPQTVEDLDKWFHKDPASTQ